MKINSIFRLSICSQDSKKVRFKIIKQPKKWRNNDTSKSKIIFEPKNNDKYCKIKSINCPQAIETNNTLYICGAWRAHDYDKLICSLRFFRKINRTLEKAIKIDNSLGTISLY